MKMDIKIKKRGPMERNLELGLMADILTAPPPRGPHRDFLLLAASALLTFASFVTTLGGAQILFPGDAITPWALSTAVQVVPFLFATGLAGQNLSWLLKSLLAVSSMSLSIVATAAFLLVTIGSPAMHEEEQVKAIAAHTALVGQLLAPQLDEVVRLKQETTALTLALQKEEARGTSSGRGKGYADKARELDRELTGASSRLATAQGILDTLKADLNYPTDGLSAKDIFQRDCEAVERIPSSLRASVPLPNEERYLNRDEQSVPLLRPIKRLLRGAPHTREVFALSALIDVIGLLIGLGVPIRSANSRRSLIQAMGLLISSCVRHGREAWRQIHDALHGRQDGVPIFPPSFAEGLLSATLANIHARLDEDGATFNTTEFICAVGGAIDPGTLVFDVGALKQKWGADTVYKQPTMLSALYLLLAALAAEPCAWIRQIDDKVWVCRDRRAFSELMHYLNQQVRFLRQFHAESSDGPTSTDRKFLASITSWIAGGLRWLFHR